MGHLCIRADAALAVLLVPEFLDITLLPKFLVALRVRGTGISIAGRKGTHGRLNIWGKRIAFVVIVEVADPEVREMRSKAQAFTRTKQSLSFNERLYTELRVLLSVRAIMKPS